MQLARLGSIPLPSGGVDYDPYEDKRKMALERDRIKKAQLDLALSKQTERENEIDLAKKALEGQEYARGVSEDAKRRGIQSRYIQNREEAGQIPLGVRAPEFLDDARPSNAPFGPMNRTPKASSMESQNIIDLAAINPDFAEAFRTGAITERRGTEDRGRTQAKEDQAQILANAADTRADRTLSNAERQQKEANNLAWFLANTGRMNAGKGASKKILPATRAVELADQSSGIGLLKKMKGSAPSGLNPFTAWFKSMNPKDTEMQGFNQYLATVKQVIGKNLEGGVLRLEDEKKYEKILPKPTDTKRTRALKEAQLSEMLVERRNEQIKGLSDAGYDLEGQDLSELDEDYEALLWATRNQNDPRAKALLDDLENR